MSNIQHDATHAPAGMTFFATSDITALTKGRALLTRNVTEGSTIGWVPANLGIGTHGHIVDEIPFGSTGDLRIKPDFASRRTIRGCPTSRTSTSSSVTSCTPTGSPGPAVHGRS